MQGLGDGGGVRLAGVSAAEEVGEEDGDQQQDQAHDGHSCTQHSHSTTPPPSCVYRVSKKRCLVENLGYFRKVSMSILKGGTLVFNVFNLSHGE